MSCCFEVETQWVTKVKSWQKFLGYKARYCIQVTRPLWATRTPKWRFDMVDHTFHDKQLGIKKSVKIWHNFRLRNMATTTWSAFRPPVSWVLLAWIASSKVRKLSPTFKSFHWTWKCRFSVSACRAAKSSSPYKHQQAQDSLKYSMSPKIYLVLHMIKIKY